MLLSEGVVTLKPVLVTIDTEGHDGADPVGHLILGETETGRYGIEYIMTAFDKVHTKVLFFVDFAEAWDYGRDKIEEIVTMIVNRGHNVGVHIHPDHMADRNRLFLWEYTRKEQYDLIKSCTDLYTEIVGQTPKSFRAGKYGANRDTLDILCELGYQYDFSEFYHQKWCGIQPPITVNAVYRYKTITEFPVTMHRSFSVGRLVREDKLDIEQMTSGELQYDLEQIVKTQFPMVATLFFHSFSLLKWRENPDAPDKNEKAVQKLERAIAAVSENTDLFFICEDDLEKISAAEENQAKDSHIVWPSPVRGFVYTYLKALNIRKTNRKARLLVAAVDVAIVAAVALLIALFTGLR